MKKAHLKTLRAVLVQPTASFHEHAVVAEVAGWAERSGVAFARDPSGNVLIRHRRGRVKRGRRWIFAAHMDHPAFVVVSQRGRTLQARFLGSVLRSYFDGARVRLFAPGGEVCATVAATRGSWDFGSHACRLELDERADVPPHTIGMWHLPAVRIRGDRLSARACDDLAGVAAILCAFDDVIASGEPADVTGLLTRGEEVWALGALAACIGRTIPGDATVVSIETSMAQPNARLGDGVVIRAGDAARTFDPPATAFLAAVAAELSGKDKAFRATRRLMPGGICEATVYSLHGHRTAALCVPLANYHNQGRNNKIRPEQIDLRDLASLIKLLAAAATRPSSPAANDEASRKTLERYLKSHRDWLDLGLGADPQFRPIREPLRKRQR